MAEMVELSKQRFSSLFKANMGKSPMEYVREIRLTTAARALLVSNKILTILHMNADMKMQIILLENLNRPLDLRQINIER